MKRPILTGLLFLLATNLTFSQDKPGSYTDQWSEVYKYELQYLPKSALQTTDSIYKYAKENNNYVQVIKAMIFQAKFATTIKEDHELYIVNHFKKEIDNSKAPIRNILENLLAKIYWQYYQKNRWRFYQRSRTSEKINKEDFRTWDLRTLFEEINHHFQNSLRNPNRLQAVDLGEIDELLIGYEGSKQYRPTLYDFIAHNALAFYQTSESSLTQPANKFEIRDERYFETSNLNKFQISIDSFSLDYNAVLVYQQLCRFHELRKDTSAYVMLEVERLEFLKNHGIFNNPNQLHTKALQNLKNRFGIHPSSTLIDFKLAEILFNEGMAYSPNINDEPQFRKKEAYEICEQAIKKWPESYGAEQCRLLRSQILNPSLSLKAERFIPINTISGMLVSYANIGNLSFSVFRISDTHKLQYQQLKNDSSRIAFIKRLQRIEFWELSLPNLGDYQEHTTESALPSLAQGQYMVIAKESDTEKIYGHVFTQVTDLVLVEKFMNNANRYQVVNRNNGSPVIGAHIHWSNIDGPSQKQYFDKLVITDKKGFATVNRYDRYYGNLMALVTTEKDTARFGNYYLSMSYSDSDDEEDHKPINAKPFMFTDRSIYRPGQKVFFKGILTKKQGDNISVVSGEYVEVYFNDPNEEEVGFLRLKTNEFGSFSGEFKIPISGLTGEYNISVEEDYEEDSKFYDVIDDFEWNEVYISVEEYKRPGFEVSFDPVIDSYRLFDTISIDGKAIAFTGAPVTNAKVVYKVTRIVRFPPWYYWGHRQNFHNSASREIANGETTTTFDGSFLINFKLIPDEQVSKDELPVFEYQITADITDINGESRSAELIVKAGYHTMNITINASEIITYNSNRQFVKINAQNLNGQKVNAKGTLHIYRLGSTDRLLRNRPWPAPDQPMWSKEEFEKLFPHDAYKQETYKEKWENKKLAYTALFETASSDSIQLPIDEKWDFGDYLIEVESKDEFNQPVNSKRKFSFRGDNRGNIPKNTMVFHDLNKPQYNIGEKVEFTIGTALKDATVIIDIEKDHKVVNTHVIHLSDNSHTIKIPVNKNDTEGFAISYYLVNFNGIKNGTQIVNVIRPAEQLQIETTTFRDKLLPGAKETWSFVIKGPNKGKLEAEVLASMYDTSLDQFKPHRWKFDPMSKSRYYTYNQIRADNSFGSDDFIMRNLVPSSFYRREQQFDQFDWFGFSIDNNKYNQYQYLNRLRVIYTDTIRQVSKVSISNNSQQQEGFISGQITDMRGEPLQGVTVLIKGTDKGTVTNVEGQYSIKAAPGEELAFSCVGCLGIISKIGKGNILNVQLAPQLNTLSEVVVIGYGDQKKASITGSVVTILEDEHIRDDILLEAAPKLKLSGSIAGVTVTNQAGAAHRVSIRGMSAFNEKSDPLYIIDGVPVTSSQISENDLASISVLKGEYATDLYGARAANGVILITTKSGQKKMDEALAKVRARKNLRETAFFYPHLKTNKKGKISFSFTTPEALTRWKLQLLAHNKNLATNTKTLQTVTNKDLMIIPNTPRFLRQGDEVVISAKITNLTNRKLDGVIGLQLSDPFTEDDVDNLFQNLERNKPFTVTNKNNTEISWKLIIPENASAVQYKLVARSGNFSDGEQNILPILSDRMLVTETLPMHVKSGQSKSFSLNKLKTNKSLTLQHHQLTLEVTSNPVWYALQALPYLMEYPHECAEQTFARYYANALAMHIVNNNDNIKKVFESWAANDGSTSKLENNEELKSIMIQETPWLRDGLSEKEQKERIARLFDHLQMQQSLESAVYKLEQMQLSNGGFPWFSGNRQANRYITQHIIAGLAHLHHLKADFESPKAKRILELGLKFLEKEILNDYKKLHERVTGQDYSKAATTQHNRNRYINANHIHYLYLRSFFPDSIFTDEVKPAIDYYKKQSATYWQEFGLYMKGMIAMEKFRSGQVNMAKSILHSLKESSITNEELGMYWKNNANSWRWDRAPIETQALLIEAFSEIEANDTTISGQKKLQTIDNLKIWLLKNKQTNRWSTTKSTTEAIYALLLKGNDWLSITEQVDVNLGNKRIMPELLNNKPELATGYFKKSWTSEQIDPSMSNVTLTKKDKGIAWGGLYWQYFEDLDKITPAETPLKLSKSIFQVANTQTGELLHEIVDGMELNVGDLLRVRIELIADRDMEFLHMKDMRAAGMEPTNVLSEYKWQDGLGYYESTRDAATNFFFNRLPKGVFVFEYDLRVNNKGNFSNGITSIQSMYAPEFSSHSEGVRLVVK